MILWRTVSYIPNLTALWDLSGLVKLNHPVLILLFYIAVVSHFSFYWFMRLDILV